MTDKNIDYENPWIYEGRHFTSDDIGTIMGSSIASPIPPLRGPTSEESTSCRRENREEHREESQVSQTGNDTTEALRILSRILAEMARILSEEKSYPSTQPLEK